MMTFDQNKGYYGQWLWLPKRFVAESILEQSLTVNVNGNDIPLYQIEDTHIALPRAYFPEDALPDIEIIDIRPKAYPKMQAKSLITLRKNQIAPDKMMRKGAEGILNMNCGSGKTVMLLHAAVEAGHVTLVLNDKIHILHQWVNEMLGTKDIPAKLDIDADRIGLIQGPPKKWKWRDCDFVLGSLRTLGKHINSITPEMQCTFGTVVWDEAHHVSAHSYLPTSHIFPGRRLGVTATPNRTDGSHTAYMAHIGPIFYTDLTQQLKPICTFIASPTKIDVTHPIVRTEIESKNGQVHHKKFAAYFGTREQELDFVGGIIASGIRNKRNMLAISPSKDHVVALHKRWPQSCILHADIPAKERLTLFRKNNLAFGTADMAVEALNKQMLDTLIILVEFSNLNWLQQSVGRTQREKEGKAFPHVVVIHHNRIHRTRRKAQDMWNTFLRWGFKCRDMKVRKKDGR